MGQANLKNQIAAAEISIRQNQPVSFIFDAIQPAKVDENDRLSLARICRRSGHHALALKVLSYPVFQKKNHRPATPEELAEYCMSLRGVGALGEARLRLSELDSRQIPEALLCEIYIALNLWDSQRAVDACDDFLRSFPSHDPYQQYVVRVNRGLAMIALGEYDQAHQELAETMSELHLNQWNRLLSNSHELLAQIYLNKTDYEKAQRHLDLADRLGAIEGSKDRLYIQRWYAVLSARERQIEQPLIDFTAVALRHGHHETVRSMDYERLLIRYDQERLDHLYFGTPFPCYRKHWLSWAQPSSDIFAIHPMGRKTLNLESGEYQTEQIATKPLALLRALVSDFYRPLQVGDLFERVFPEEPFDSERSFQRIHQLIYRTRGWLEQHRVPLQIQEREKGYVLVVDKSLKVLVPKASRNHPSERRLKALSDHFSHREFTAKEAERVLEVSAASTHRVLRDGLDHGGLLQSRFGLQTRYQFSTHISEE